MGDLRYSMHVVDGFMDLFRRTAVNNGGRQLIPARRRGEGKVFRHRLFLELLRKDGRPDGRRQMQFEFGKLKVLACEIHIKWHDVYYGSSGELRATREGSQPPEAVEAVARRLNDLSKRRPYGEAEALEFLDQLRKTVMANEVMSA